MFSCKGCNSFECVNGATCLDVWAVSDAHLLKFMECHGLIFKDPMCPHCKSQRMKMRNIDGNDRYWCTSCRKVEKNYRPILGDYQKRGLTAKEALYLVAQFQRAAGMSIIDMHEDVKRDEKVLGEWIMKLEHAVAYGCWKVVTGSEQWGRIEGDATYVSCRKGNRGKRARTAGTEVLYNVTRVNSRGKVVDFHMVPLTSEETNEVCPIVENKVTPRANVSLDLGTSTLPLQRRNPNLSVRHCNHSLGFTCKSPAEGKGCRRGTTINRCENTNGKFQETKKKRMHGVLGRKDEHRSARKLVTWLIARSRLAIRNERCFPICLKFMKLYVTAVENQDKGLEKFEQFLNRKPKKKNNKGRPKLRRGLKLKVGKERYAQLRTLIQDFRKSQRKKKILRQFSSSEREVVHNLCGDKIGHQSYSGKKGDEYRDMQIFKKRRITA